MIKNYGLPYQGSKNTIIPWLMAQLPSAGTFVDLFAGGCSVSHAAIVSGKYKSVIANDITDSAFVFRDAVNGRFHNERRWISRDDFFRLKDDDPYVRLCFSFGNDQRSYIYARELESYKEACHYAIVFDDWHKLKTLCPEVTSHIRSDLSALHCDYPFTNGAISLRRITFGNSLLHYARSLDDEILKKNALYRQCKLGGGYGLDVTDIPVSLQSRTFLADRKPVNLVRGGKYGKSPEVNNIERLYRVQNLERLGAFNSLENIPPAINLKVSQSDYRNVVIPDDSVVYCDPPYKSTKKYLCGFNHDEFYSWCLSRSYPVYVSEYSMPDGFTAIAETTRLDSQSATKVVRRRERIFVQSRYARRCCRSFFLPSDWDLQ